MKHIAEIVESSITEIIAQCVELNQSPAFGSFIKISGNPVSIGLVFNVKTESLEPNRRPIAYGKTEEELMSDQPQIFELLKTNMQALLVGYKDGNKFRQSLPPFPPRIHQFIYECTEKEVKEFTENLDYLRTIFNAKNAPVDEIIIASSRYAYFSHDKDSSYLVNIGKELSRLMRDDYDRLNSIIRRIM